MPASIIHHLTTQPRQLFLTDSLGALLTTFMLAVVLKHFHQYIGMPAPTLNYLAIIAACFSIYSAACFLFLKQNYPVFIRLISAANLLYCVLTTGLVIVYYPLLTAMGVAYFAGEVVVVCTLVYVELTVATAISITGRTEWAASSKTR